MCAGLGHSVGALMSHRGGRTHGHGWWETGNDIYVTAGSIFQVQTHRDGAGGLCNGDVSSSRKHSGDNYQSFSPGEEEQIPSTELCCVNVTT